MMKQIYIMSTELVVFICNFIFNPYVYTVKRIQKTIKILFDVKPDTDN